MEPYTEKLAQGELTAEAEDFVIGKCRYLAEIEPGEGWVLERGPKGLRGRASTRSNMPMAVRTSTIFC